MKVIKLRDGKQILLIELKDIDRSRYFGNSHEQKVRQIIGTSRAYFDVIVLNVSSRNGPSVLPLYLRQMNFRAKEETNGSYWILEKDENEMFV